MSSDVDYIIRHRDLDLVHDGQLTVAAYANFYPVCYKEKGKIKGLDVDIMQHFCKIAGLKLVLKEVKHWDGLWLQPIKGHSDTSIGGIGISEVRTTKDTEWTIPYFYVQRTLIYNRNDPIKNLNEITGIVRGTVGSTGWLDALTRLKSAGMQKHLQPGKTDVQDIKDLAEGKIQGLMRGSFVGVAIVKSDPKTFGMVKPWEILPELVSSDGECFAYPCHKDSGLATVLSSFLTKAWMNGSLHKALVDYDLL